jgi:hypothetical protein
VGDLRAAAASGETCAELVSDWAFLAALRWRKASSLCSLIRMDRFAGAISSPADEALDFERVWREGESRLEPREGGCSSISESEAMAEDEAMEGDRRAILRVLDCEGFVLVLGRRVFSDREASDLSLVAGLDRRGRVRERATW